MTGEQFDSFVDVLDRPHVELARSVDRLESPGLADRAAQRGNLSGRFERQRVWVQAPPRLRGIQAQPIGDADHGEKS
jgi:hypothetical protein